MTTAEIAIFASAATAVAGYFSAYWSNRRLAQRKDQLDRINRQLSDLYGPLYALLQASTRTWDEFRKRNRPNGGFWVQGQTTHEEASVWRAWMSIVFMPLNRKMMDVIVDHGDLVIEEVMPACLHELCAHVAGYEPIVKAWSNQDFKSVSVEDHVSILLWPNEIHWYVNSSFTGLKRKQSELLTQIKPRWERSR